MQEARSSLLDFRWSRYIVLLTLWIFDDATGSSDIETIYGIWMQVNLKHRLSRNLEPVTTCAR